VRQEWVNRYNTQLQALRTLGLGVGTPKEEIKERYESLCAALHDLPSDHDRRREIQHAFEVLRPDS
jgi:hypothetical protein